MKNIIGDMGRLVFVCLLLVGLLGSWRVGGFPAEDLVARLPGQPDVGFKQFAGYVDVDVKAGRSLFYYFAEAEADADNKPLTLWLNGGPGCSSVGGGAFTELGPFFPRGDGRGLLINSNSWNKVSNLLFVESPAGVGWSYSNTTSDYTTGDAATGHYIPQLAEVLLNHNEYSNGLKFNIKGVAIGNPLLRLDRDIPAVYEYFWSHGMISDEIYLTVTDRYGNTNMVPSLKKILDHGIPVWIFRQAF
ncbi:Serine carboxypeptidase-like 42 [Acorus gramineus]|uniref:Serine carboxypeptidase-like 42 n=1 Tax=Acorus gramineus TaxID=55184 RepID=A0AAV9AV16_ACOGR|nr:Serine carboxypeptidase-like 42 [Acorus gramineus]